MFLNRETAPDMAPTPTAEEAQALLHTLEQDLDLPRQAPRRSYYLRYALQHRLPRLALVGLVLLTGLLLGIALFTPTTIRTGQAMESDGAAWVEFRVGKPLLVQSVNAWLDGVPQAVQPHNSSYYVGVRSNGTLQLEARTVTGIVTTATMAIDILDDMPPQLVDDTRVGDTVRIYISDGEGSGIDWAAISARDAATGATVAPAACDEEEGWFSYPFPEDTLYITIPDKSGNLLTAVLSPLVVPAA